MKVFSQKKKKKKKSDTSSEYVLSSIARCFDKAFTTGVPGGTCIRFNKIHSYLLTSENGTMFASFGLPMVPSRGNFRMVATGWKEWNFPCNNKKKSPQQIKLVDCFNTHFWTITTWNKYKPKHKCRHKQANICLSRNIILTWPNHWATKTITNLIFGLELDPSGEFCEENKVQNDRSSQGWVFTSVVHHNCVLPSHEYLWCVLLHCSLAVSYVRHIL